MSDLVTKSLAVKEELEGLETKLDSQEQRQEKGKMTANNRGQLSSNAEPHYDASCHGNQKSSLSTSLLQKLSRDIRNPSERFKNSQIR